MVSSSVARVALLISSGVRWTLVSAGLSCAYSMRSLFRKSERRGANTVPGLRNVSRRRFLQASGGLILAVGFRPTLAQEDTLYLHRGFSPNAFVRIASDNTVTVIVKHLEMGQGTYTGLPTLVAEELDADWAQIRAEGAPADAKRYNNLSWGEAQGTGGSSSLPNSYEPMRKAGAAARA